jgi:hypothetical protein
MKTVLVNVMALLLVPVAGHAHSTENTLFTCRGELIKSKGYDRKTYYGIVERVSNDDVYPMYCYIEAGKPERHILAVCRVGDTCLVGAKGESGNANRHLI